MCSSECRRPSRGTRSLRRSARYRETPRAARRLAVSLTMNAYSNSLILFCRAFIEPAQMHAVDKPVVDLNGKAQRFAAVFLPDVFAPGDARDGVVYVDLPLICTAGEIEPRKTRDIDQIIRFRGRLQKRGLRFAPLLRGAAKSASVPSHGHVMIWNCSLPFFRYVKLGVRLSSRKTLPSRMV